MRLESNISDLYVSDNQNNFSYLTENIQQNNLQEMQLNIPQHSRLYIPTENGDLEEYKYDSIKGFSKDIEEKLNLFNEFLIEKNA